MIKKVVWVVFLLGLIYVAWPGPTSIDDFPPLPSSTKSNLPGDTTQNPNIAAYYSQFDRNYITKYYRSIFEQMPISFLPLPVIRINHRVEEAYGFVRDQQESTFLEEFIHPMRESVFVNGYEPAIENQMNGVPSGFIEDHISIYGNFYASKATLRYYPSSWIWRVLIYLVMWVLMGMLYKLTKQFLAERYVASPE